MLLMKSNKDVLMEFGRNVRAERNRKGLSQEELAFEVGLSSGMHISNIERGVVDTKLCTVVAILKVLKIDFNKLYEL